MEDSEKAKINYCLPYLCENTTHLSDILIYLFTKFLINADEKQAIESKITDYEKHEALYSTIQRKSPKAFKELCIALECSQNQKALSYLILSVPPTRSVDYEPMRKSERQRICANFDYLISNTNNLHIILTELRSLGIINEAEGQKINYGTTNTDKLALLYLNILNKRPNPFVQLITTLRKSNNVHIIQKLLAPMSQEEIDKNITTIQPVLTQYQISTVQYLPIQRPSNIWFQVRPKCKNFVGREIELQNLHQSICSQNVEINNESAMIPKFTVVCGIGGIGKSELVASYIQAYHRDNSVVWINAKNSVTLRESFYGLAVDELNLSIQEDSSDITSLVSKVYRRFQNQVSIFVFDNAENTVDRRNEEGIDRYIPTNFTPGIRRPYILVTSQNKDWNSPYQTWDVIPLNPFTRNESLEYIRKCITEVVDADDVFDLCMLMKGLPLALYQAVDYINLHSSIYANIDQVYGIRDYIETYELKQKELLSHRTDLRVSDQNHPHLFSVYITWLISKESMEMENYGDQACHMLNILAYLDSTDIPAHLFTENFNNFNDRRRLCLVLDLLKRYSMIKIIGGQISIHDLLQTVVRLNLQNQPGQEQACLEYAMDILNKKLPTDENNLTMTFKSKWLYPHCIQAWEYAMKYPKIVTTHHKLLTATSVYLQMKGNIYKANQLLDHGKKHMALNPEDPYDPGMIQAALNVLTHFIAGNQTEAKNGLEALATAARTVDSNSSALNDQSKIALEYLKQPTNLSTMAFGTPNQAQVSTLLNTLEKMLVSARKEEDVSGPGSADPFNLATTLELITSGIRHVRGDKIKASNTLNKIGNDLAATFGPDHLLTRMTRLTEASALNDQGENSAALNILQNIQRTEKQEQSKSSEYEKPSASAWDLVMTRIGTEILNTAGLHNEAQSAIRKTIQTNARAGKEKSNNPVLTLPLQVDEGVTLVHLGKCAEALSTLQSTLTKCIMELGPVHQTTLAATCGVVLALEKLGRNQDALELSTDAYNKIISVFGTDHSTAKDMKFIVSELVKRIDTEMLD